MDTKINDVPIAGHAQTARSNLRRWEQAAKQGALPSISEQGMLSKSPNSTYPLGCKPLTLAFGELRVLLRKGRLED